MFDCDSIRGTPQNDMSYGNANHCLEYKREFLRTTETQGKIATQI